MRFAVICKPAEHRIQDVCTQTPCRLKLHADILNVQPAPVCHAAHSRSAKGAMAMPHPQSAPGATVPKTAVHAIAMFCGSAGLRNLCLLGGHPGIGFLQIQRLLVEGSA